MKFFVQILVLWGLVALDLEASEFPDDVFLFLPFLKNLESPPPCPQNEMYKNCLTNCSTCEERGLCPIQSCTDSGCDCVPRYFRLTPGGPCQPVSLCPKPECGENEFFRDCGPLCESCNTYRCRVIQCDYKCYCKQGYLRDKNGTCVPEEECPRKEHCSRVEEWAESGPVDEYCIRIDSAIASNETQEVEQCYCRDGYKRNMMGHCIHEHFCSMIMCMGHEIYQECISKCNTTCRNYDDLDCEEDGQCYPGCFCPPNYVMSDSSSCIPVDECPEVSTTENPIDTHEENKDGSTTENPIYAHEENKDGLATENPMESHAENKDGSTTENPIDDHEENKDGSTTENPMGAREKNKDGSTTENPMDAHEENKEGSMTENPMDAHEENKEGSTTITTISYQESEDPDNKTSFNIMTIEAILKATSKTDTISDETTTAENDFDTYSTTSSTLSTTETKTISSLPEGSTTTELPDQKEMTTAANDEEENM